MNSEQLSSNPNAWLILKDKSVTNNGHSIVIESSPELISGMKIGDGVLLVNEKNSQNYPLIAARIFKLSVGLTSVQVFFDALTNFTETENLSPIDVVVNSPISRLDWLQYQAILNTAGLSFETLKVFVGESIAEQNYIRKLLKNALADDLLGPADGPFEEITGMSVRDRYLLGKLAPKETYLQADQDDDIGSEGDEEGNKELEASKSQSLVPSSIGVTFCIAGDVTDFYIEGCWGRYIREESEETVSEKTEKPIRAWRRYPSGGKIKLSVKEGLINPIILDEQCPEVVIQGLIRPKLPNSDRLITLFLVNNQTKPEKNQDSAWIFQPEIIAYSTNQESIFRRRPLIDTYGDDSELDALEMVYRKRIEYAVGHGVSVHVKIKNQQPVEIRTVVMPEFENPVTETPGLEAYDRPVMQRLVREGILDMEYLSTLERSELTSALKLLTEDYSHWIDEQSARITKELPQFSKDALAAIDRCKVMQARLQEGISILETNEYALEAFRFATKAMAIQRVRSIYSLRKRRGEEVEISDLDIPKNRSWRPFQLAFILLSIPALSDPEHKDRSEAMHSHADLLWFPTGGGKTEAYLGVAAFTMSIRRLQKDLGGYDASRGLAVIMRYTLRLLTIQQFQRATTLLCAMEVIRKKDIAKWGTEPFTLGLWVGNKITPGTTEQSHRAIESERDGKRVTGASPAQLTFCPWCGNGILPGRDIHVDRNTGRTAICCGDKLSQCEFSKSNSEGLGLPVIVVDDEIYRRPPTMLIGTVDKFAMMAWRGQTRSLFGKVSQECERHGLLWPDSECKGAHTKKGVLPATKIRQISAIRPPDLIIQDEFHLISGPLGTIVGLYETAIDELSSWKLNGKVIRPKIVASTATVRKASEQVHNVFLRKVAVFPPHGLDIEDNFFSVQRPIEEKPGRLYIGICSPGSSRPAVLIRLYVALLTAGQALYDKFGSAADPYMTLVGYFNSLRELGGMRRLAEDDVQTRSFRVQMGQVYRPGLSQRTVKVVDELTSRVANKEIPKKLDQLEIKFKSSWQKGETRAIDIVLATNMLSVGVDVNRLGLMAVNGQPKNTAEYIQATSRVGRSSPGLVCTVMTWSRPRDLSHYETFENYHATFYKHVEAQSVTPFAPRALDRGLTGTLTSLLRLSDEKLNGNLGADNLNSISDGVVINAKKVISDRAWKVTNKNTVKQESELMISDRIDQWVKESTRGGRRLGYEAELRQGDIVPLLKKPGVKAWDEFTAPMSMREVEPSVGLIMDTSKFDDGPVWKSGNVKSGQSK